MPKETLTDEKKSTPTASTTKSENTTRPVGTKINLPVLRLETRSVPDGSNT